MEKIIIQNINDLFNITTSLRSRVNEEKIVLIKGAPILSSDEFVEFSKLVSGKENEEESFISWDFGRVMELKEGSESGNYLFSNEKVPFHWDGAFHEVPNILVFQNLVSLEGGNTLFTDTEKILEDLDKLEIEKLKETRIKYSTKKVAHYGGEIVQPVLDINPITGKSVLRFGEEVVTNLNPVVREIYPKENITLISKLEELLYSEKYCISHQWEEGDILLSDNFSTLHAREPFVSKENKKRHLRRIQIR